jgi:hypothetical protein
MVSRQVVYPCDALAAGAVKRIAKMLRSHRALLLLLLNWFKAKGEIELGVVEGLNGNAKLAIRSEKRAAFERTRPWKPRTIINLATCPSRNSPTSSVDEAIHSLLCKEERSLLTARGTVSAVWAAVRLWIQREPPPRASEAQDSAAEMSFVSSGKRMLQWRRGEEDAGRAAALGPAVMPQSCMHASRGTC